MPQRHPASLACRVVLFLPYRPLLLPLSPSFSHIVSLVGTVYNKVPGKQVTFSKYNYEIMQIKCGAVDVSWDVSLGKSCVTWVQFMCHVMGHRGRAHSYMCVSRMGHSVWVSAAVRRDRHRWEGLELRVCGLGYIIMR